MPENSTSQVQPQVNTQIKVTCRLAWPVAHEAESQNTKSKHKPQDHHDNENERNDTDNINTFRLLIRFPSRLLPGNVNIT